MKTEVTTVTERGQVSIPASIRKQLALAPGQRLCWEVLPDQTCKITPVHSPGRAGADAMRGYAKSFRKTRTTDEWMKELRGGEAQA